MRSGYDWWEDLPNEALHQADEAERWAELVDNQWRRLMDAIDRLREVVVVGVLRQRGLTYQRGNLFSGKGTRT